MGALTNEKVLIATSTFAEHSRQPLDLLRAEGAEIILNPHGRKLTAEELVGLLDQGVTGIIAGLEPLSREVLERSRLRVVSRCGAGTSNVDLDAAKERRIAVFTTPDAPVDSVAELTVGALLCLLRRITLTDADMHAGLWKKKTGGLLKGKTVLIIGYGRIGRRVGSLLAAFGARIIAHDPAYTGTGKEKDSAPSCSFEDGIQTADIICVHASGDTPIIGTAQFALMKKGVYLLNAARGNCIEEQALIAALDEERLAGVWLDTFEEEPYTGPLRTYPAVLLTPHIGSYTVECRTAMELEAAQNLLRGFKRPSGD